ncbi:MAG: anthranilate synthase component 1 [Succinivibrionaceae bacterium]
MANININDFVLDVDYVAQPQELFEQITQPFDNSLLLESAEINTKAGTTSMLIVDAACRLSCLGRTVFSQALTPNGFNVNEQLKKLIPESCMVQERGNTLIIQYPEIATDIDEDSRLKALSVLDLLRKIIRDVECDQGKDYKLLGGCFAYDLIASFEKLPQVGISSNDCPDFCFYLAESQILINHIHQTTRVVTTTFKGSREVQERARKRALELKAYCDAFKMSERKEPVPVKLSVCPDLTDEEYCKVVDHMKDHIRQGDIFQVVPSRTFAIQCPSTFAAYSKLKETNPSPYMFYLNDEQFTVFGASPESSVKYTAETNDVEMYPIAGTRPRGFNSKGGIDVDLDCRIELAMREDKKEVAEHIMLVDLARNDIARISVPGTRHVKDLLKVDRYSHVMHLVSRVVGQLRPDLDALHAYQACMNMGTLTGAPKIRATELIRVAERKRRGSYGGAMGYLNGRGDMDTCIVIRSAFVKNGVAYVQSGAGIVYDSVPQSEADETRNKAAAVLNAIALANGTTLKEIL